MSPPVLVTVPLVRETDAGDVSHDVRCRVTLGTEPRTNCSPDDYDPGDPAEVEILSVAPVATLTAAETERVEEEAIDAAATGRG